MKRRVILFGDETAAGFDPGAPGIFLPPEARYAAVLGERFELVVDADKARPLLVAGSPELCLAQLRACLDRHAEGAVCAVLQLGTRDLGRAAFGADLANGLRFLVKECLDRGLRCLVVGHPGVRVSALPTDPGVPRRDAEAAREERARVSAEYLESLGGLACSGCRVLDLSGRQDLLGADGLHPAREAQTVLGRLVADAVEELLRE